MAILIITILIVVIHIIILPFFSSEQYFSSHLKGQIESSANESETRNATDGGINGTIIAAIIAALTSVGGIIVTQHFGRKNQNTLLSLQEQTEMKKIKENARVDYEYQALKRLYTEVEPILFQFVDYSESAYRRIRGLAINAKNGELDPDHGFLSINDSDYMASTIYRLICPISVCKVLQTKITNRIDFQVDPSVKLIYSLVKGLYPSFTSDYGAASAEPSILYDPYVSAPQEKSRLQGIPIKRLDELAGLLLVKERKNELRIMSFGEFTSNFFSSNPKPPVLEEFTNLFLKFHPSTNPVLWRILLLQAHIYKAVLKISENRSSKVIASELPLKMMPMEERQQFDWRQNSSQSFDADVWQDPFKAVEQLIGRDPYLEKLFVT